MSIPSLSLTVWHGAEMELKKQWPISRYHFPLLHAACLCGWAGLTIEGHLRRQLSPAAAQSSRRSPNGFGENGIMLDSLAPGPSAG
jgi:hypothetical protein